jgi:hypothetical protein
MMPHPLGSARSLLHLFFYSEKVVSHMGLLPTDLLVTSITYVPYQFFSTDRST